MKNLGRRNLLGIAISAVDYEAAVAKIMSCAHGGTTWATSALAVHGLVTGALDPTHRHRLNSLNMVVPDGQPVRWALNWLYDTSLNDRVYGPKLTYLVCQAAAQQRCPVYFYGSSPKVMSRLKSRMAELCPGLTIAGTQPSQFRSLRHEEWDQLVEQIRSSGAKILFVGLGCPRQEVFVFEIASRLQMPILAVGAAFDYYSGLLREPRNSFNGSDFTGSFA